MPINLSSSQLLQKTLIGIIIILIGFSGYAFYFYQQNFNLITGWGGSAETFNELADNWAGLDNIPGILLAISPPASEEIFVSSGKVKLNSEINISQDTPFHIASVGKLFTAVAVLKLHEKKVLNIYDTIDKYLPTKTYSNLVSIKGEDFSSTITIKQLLSHTSGLGNTDSSIKFQSWIFLHPNKKRTPLELIEFGKKIPAVSKPGQKASYSSVGYFLLGLIIENVTKNPYYKIIRQEVFEPLRMMNTKESNFEWKRKFETSHHYQGFIDISNLDPSFEFADGGFITTLKDLIKFGKALVNNQLFENPTTWNLMTTQIKENYGLGIFHGKMPDGTRYLGHSGYWGVRLIMYPDSSLVFAYTLNQSNVKSGDFMRQVHQILVKKSLL